MLPSLTCRPEPLLVGPRSLSLCRPPTTSATAAFAPTVSCGCANVERQREVLRLGRMAWRKQKSQTGRQAQTNGLDTDMSEDRDRGLTEDAPPPQESSDVRRMCVIPFEVWIFPSLCRQSKTRVSLTAMFDPDQCRTLSK